MAGGITWRTEQRRLGDLRDWDKNPRQLSQHDYEHIGISLEKFGLADPLVANLDNRLIGGHQRKRVLLGNGYTPDSLVDVRVPDRQLSEAEADELAMRLNKNQGDWDWDALANLFDPDDLKNVGFTEWELNIVAPPPRSPAKPGRMGGARRIATTHYRL